MHKNIHIENFDEKLKNYRTKLRIFKLVKEHFFTNYTDDDRIIEMICTTANMAFENETIFEEYRIWSKDRDDKSLLYYIEQYFQDALKEEKLRDRGYNKIDDEREILKSKFLSNLKKIANSKGLTTNKKLGMFLSISEERARVLLSGKNKPQRKTLLNISDKFKVPVEELDQ